MTNTNTDTETARELVWVYYDHGARGWCVQLFFGRSGEGELISCHYTRAQAEQAAHLFAAARGCGVEVHA